MTKNAPSLNHDPKDLTERNPETERWSRGRLPEVAAVAPRNNIVLCRVTVLHHHQPSLSSGELKYCLFWSFCEYFWFFSSSNVILHQKSNNENKITKQSILLQWASNDEPTQSTRLNFWRSWDEGTIRRSNTWQSLLPLTSDLSHCALKRPMTQKTSA